MNIGLWLTALAGSLVMSACASFEVGGEFQAGRRAYLTGQNETALAYFRSAAEKEPDYLHGTTLRQNVWSYVGRAEYETGRYAQAQGSLEKALSRKQDGELTRLYLGLALARAGERERGRREIEAGMKGMHEWLEYITEAHRFSFGQFWDPRREIRTAIEADMAMLSGKDVDWQRLVDSGEQLGRRMEEEADRAQRDERMDFDRDSDDGRP